MGCQAFLQRIFLTLGSNLRHLCLLYCRRVLYPQSHLESPSITLGLFFCLGCTSITWGIFKTLVPRLLPTSDLFPGISGFQSSLGGPTCSLQGEEWPGHRPVSAEQLPVALGGGWALHSEPELTGHFKSGGLFLLFPSCPFSSC